MEPLSSVKGSLVGMPYPILLGVDKRAQSSSLKPGMSRDWLLVCHCAINAFLVTSRLLRRWERSLRPFYLTAKAPGIWVHPKVDWTFLISQTSVRAKPPPSGCSSWGFLLQDLYLWQEGLYACVATACSISMSKVNAFKSKFSSTLGNTEFTYFLLHSLGHHLVS